MAFEGAQRRIFTNQSGTAHEMECKVYAAHLAQIPMQLMAEVTDHRDVVSVTCQDTEKMAKNACSRGWQNATFVSFGHQTTGAAALQPAK